MPGICTGGVEMFPQRYFWLEAMEAIWPQPRPCKSGPKKPLHRFNGNFKKISQKNLETPARSPYHYGINTGSIRISSVLIPYLSRNDRGGELTKIKTSIKKRLTERQSR